MCILTIETVLRLIGWGKVLFKTSLSLKAWRRGIANWVGVLRTSHWGVGLNPGHAAYCCILNKKEEKESLFV